MACLIASTTHQDKEWSIINSLFDEFVCKLGFRFTRVLNWRTRAKKAQLTHERVEYNVFFFDEPLTGSKSLEIFKISLTFRSDKF
jgi:hypothetical protein